ILGRDPTGAGYTVPSSVGRMFTLFACCVRSAMFCLLQVTAAASIGSLGSDTWVWLSSARREATFVCNSPPGFALAAWNSDWAAESPWSEPATVNQTVMLVLACGLSV